MARKKKKGGGEGGGAGWLVTYSDLMTLLLCFFVLLYGMSTVDEGKMKQLAESLRQALNGSMGLDILDEAGKDEGTEETEEQSEEDAETLTEEESEMLEEIFDVEYSEELMDGYAEEIHDAVEQFLENQNLGSEVQVEVVKEGVLLNIKDQVFFDLGKSQIKTESLKLLDKLGNLFNKFNNEIRIEGHTDSIPISTTQYPSNWELASARSCAIVRYYITQGFEPTRLLCTSYGETKPIATNETEFGRSQNRRVNFLVVANSDELKEFVELLNEGK